MFIRKTIAVFLIAMGILGLLLTGWEFTTGSWFLAATGSDIPYGQFFILGAVSLACLIGVSDRRDISIPP